MWKWETENDAKGVVVIAHNILEHTGRYAYVITMLRRNGYHVIMGDRSEERRVGKECRL